jgi:serine protease Do
MEPEENKFDPKANDQSQAPAEPSYVYPHPANAWQAQTPYGQPYSPVQPPQPPKKHPVTHTIGLIAIFLAVAVLFSAITGGLVYTIMKNQEATTQTTPADQQTAPTTTEKKTAETTKSAQPTTGGSTDKHWSIADAATRSNTSRKALSIIDIAAEGKPAVVAINTQVSMTDMFGQTGNYAAAGSGFIISKDGYIVTNNHVIEGAKTITVVLDNGDIYDAKLIGTDAREDIAVIKISASNLPTVYFGTSDDLEVGELAVAIGNPLGELSGTVTAGIISALDRDITIDGQAMKLLQTDAAINSGNSGGALFNSFGEVIGINTAKNTGTGVEGLGFAIPIDHAKPIIESLIQYGYVQGRPKIGISTRDVTAQMAQYYKLTVGVYVYEVESGSAADLGGLKAEDIIVAANGQETLTTEALSEVKSKLKVGDKMVLTVVRDGKKQEITIILKEEVPTVVKPTSSRQSGDFI